MTGILAYSTTFVLGLLHAFEPGHGKSILAAFSLRKTNMKIFSSLIFSLFISHFFVLGLFALGLQQMASTELVVKYSDQLQFITPLLLIGYGVYLFYKARKHRETESGCSCGHNHSSSEISSMKTASITGFIAGLMPCPTAIAPLIISGIHEGFSFTLVHIFIYVTGMTVALFVFTGFLLIMKSFFQNKINQVGGKINLNFLSALIMITIGLVYLIVNVLSPESHIHF